MLSEISRSDQARCGGAKVMMHEQFLANLFSCPECKSQMKQTQRREENGCVFMWFECTKPDCGGQWLYKMPTSGANARVAG